MPIWRPDEPHYPGMGYPPTIVRAQGAYLYTAEGQAIWDGTCAWWVTVHGHCHPTIAEAIAQAAYTLDQVLFADFSHPAAETLTQKLTARTGLPYAFFSDDGSTAVEIALKIAIQYFRNRGERHRTTFLALEGAYHGDTFGAMSVSARGLFTAPYEEWLFRVEWLPFPWEPERFYEAVQRLEGREDIVAFIGEPLLQGAAGMRGYPPIYWDAVAATVRKTGALIIADEVFTGFGRTGQLFATDACQEKPDILCLSKGLTGGFLPMGLTLVSQAVFEAFYTPDPYKAFYHGHSYTGNPIACAAAVANLQLWEAPETWQRLHTLNATQAALAKEWNARHPEAPARATGLVLAIDLPTPKKGYLAPHRTLLKAYALERGIFLRPLGNVAYFLPALSSTPDELYRAA
ncbi:MAG: adenosylmethionine--8-amino-7-oxononanoate transaminase, partial [Bacteroidetes bacterium]